MAAALRTGAFSGRPGGGRGRWLDWMVVPTLLVLAVIVGYPVVYTLALSAQEYNLLCLEPPQFVAAENFRYLLADRICWHWRPTSEISPFGGLGLPALMLLGGPLRVAVGR